MVMKKNSDNVELAATGLAGCIVLILVVLGNVLVYGTIGLVILGLLKLFGVIG